MPFVSRYRRFAGGLRPVAKLLACGALLCLSIIVATAALVVQQRQRAMAETERDLRNISLILSEELDRSFQALEIVQTAIIDQMRIAGIATEADYLSRMSGFEVHDMLRQQIAGLPHVDAITLISRDGRLINFSRYWPIPQVVVTDRDYFKALAADPKLQSFVSEPVRNRGTGTWTIYIARKVTAPDGSFLGLVLGAMRLAYFEHFYQSIALGPDSSIAMFRQDGILLARHPHIDPQIGRPFGQTANFQRLLNALDRGMVRQVSTMDGKDRLMASHRVPHFPVVTVVTTATAAALADWRRQAGFLSAGAALLVVVIAGIVLAIVRQIRAEALLHQARSAQQQAEVELRLMRERAESARVLQVQYARFDAALNNMLQGLAMFDRDDNLLVCNRRCLGMLGIDGSQAPPGIHFSRMLLPAVAAGKLTPQDVEALVQQVAALAADSVPGTFVWPLASGATLSVSYQPMEDAGWLVTFENITARRHAEAQIAYLAHHDALTGLPNRILFRRKLHETLAHSLRGKGCAVLCLDLDRFKRVNDTLGHPIGDGLLKAVTARILDCIRETDTAARLGGDEFVIVQTALDAPVDATVLASRLIEALSAPFQVDGHQVVIGASVGIAFAPQDGSDPDQLLKSADMALFRAKVDGRGVYRLFHAEMDAEMQARRALELDLRAALRTGQFTLYFQPLIELRTRGVTGFEALLRWQHPERGVVAPTEFIPLAEEIGLIVPLGEWVLQHACHTAMTWPESLKVAVNISPIQFRSASLVAAVALALRSSGLPPSRLELEITEAVLLHDTDSTLATLHALRELGVAIVMDDFGTGYSSLSYLRQFPFSKIKIDQSFVRDLQSRKDCAAIVRAVASLGIDLGMNTTAEGVETPEQLAALAEAGCTTVQGFMFSPPRPAEDVIAELERLALGRHDAAAPGPGRLAEKLASAAD